MVERGLCASPIIPKLLNFRLHMAEFFFKMKCTDTQRHNTVVGVGSTLGVVVSSVPLPGWKREVHEDEDNAIFPSGATHRLRKEWQ
jgi:hypothetical protein